MSVELRGAGGRVVCSRCELADSMSGRIKGLLGRRSLDSGEGLLLRPAGSIHTGFMRFDIDVVFLDRELTVLRVVEHLRPWRMVARCGARAVLELAAGEAARHGIEPGQRLELRESPAQAPAAA